MKDSTAQNGRRERPARGDLAPAAGGDAGIAAARVFTYDARRYLFDVQIAGVIGAAAMVVGAVLVATGMQSFIGLIAIVLGLYTAFNTFVAKCYPRVATLNDERISFESFGRRDVYRLEDITRIQLRENARALSVYVRVDGGGIMKGRYFVGCGDMTDQHGERARALYDFLLDLQARLDPDNIRVRARGQAGAAPPTTPGDDRPTRR